MQAFLTKNRWAVLATAILVMICTGIWSLWAVFQPYVASTYHYSPDAATFVMPLTVASFGIFSIFGGLLQDRVSPFICTLLGGIMLGTSFLVSALLPPNNPVFFYLGFSVIQGAGCGFLYGGTFTCLMKWFPDRKGFANGMMGAIPGLVSIPLTYISDSLLSEFGTREILFVFGLICLVVCVGGAFVFVNPTDEYLIKMQSKEKHEMHQTKKPQKAILDFTTLEMLRTKQYYLILAAIIFSYPAYMLICPALVSIGMEKGLSKEMALGALAVSNAAAAAGRLLVPWASDVFGRKRMMIYMYIIMTAGSVFFINSAGVSVIVIFAAISFVNSGAITCTGPLTNDLFGFKNSGTNMGFVLISDTLGAMIGPASVGLLAPAFGYNTTYYVGIAGGILALIAVCVLNTNMAETRQKMDGRAQLEK